MHDRPRCRGHPAIILTPGASGSLFFHLPATPLPAGPAPGDSRDAAPHLATIAAAVGAVLVGFAGWTIFSSQQASEKADSWDACLSALSAGDVAKLRDVSGRYPNTPAATWSQILLADGALAEGCRMAFVDKQRGREQCQVAADLYAGVLAQRPADLAGERAAFGLAKAREALGQLDLARQGYETLAAEHADGPLRSVAEERAKRRLRPSLRIPRQIPRQIPCRARRWASWSMRMPPGSGSTCFCTGRSPIAAGPSWPARSTPGPSASMA